MRVLAICWCLLAVACDGDSTSSDDGTGGVASGGAMGGGGAASGGLMSTGGDPGGAGGSAGGTAGRLPDVSTDAAFCSTAPEIGGGPYPHGLTVLAEANSLDKPYAATATATGVAVARGGGAIQLWVPGEAAPTELAAGTVNIQRMIAAGGGLYWSELGADGTRRVGWVTLADPGNVSYLDFPAHKALAADETNVYLGNIDDGGLYQMPIGSDTPTLLAAGLNAQALTVAGVRILANTNGGLATVNKADGVVNTLHTGVVFDQPVASATHVFWSTQHGVSSMPIMGGSETQILDASASQGFISDLQLVGTRLYWIMDDGTCSKPCRMGTDGTGVEVFVSAEAADRFAIHAEQLYFGTSGGQLLRIDI